MRGELDKLQETLAGFPLSSNRYTEARYHEGLARFHRGEKEKALDIWKSTISEAPQDRWVYRMDWAYSNVKDGSRKSFSSGGKRTSILGRIGYMGRRNPDLEGPPKWSRDQ